MNWEATPTTPRPAGPGWHPDPLDPTRLRWWDGAAWTARIARLEPGSEAISWHAGIGDLAAPDPRGEAPALSSEPAAIGPISTAPRVLAPVPRLEAPGEPDEDSASATSKPRNLSRRTWAALAAAVILLAAGAGMGTATLGEEQRPRLASTIRFADTDAELRFRYPHEWRVDKETPGVGVRFVVSNANASALETNTVQVKTDPAPVPLPALHVLANQTTEQVVAELADFRMVSAEQTRLASGPAFRLELVDTTTEPVKRIIEYVGTTDSGRPLYVIVTVREPRTAPTEAELRRFLESITSS
ncbi:MAG: DUF2510 domain-containing protein [Acidimicrobiia bacterium]